MTENTPYGHLAQPDECRWQSIGELAERLKGRVVYAMETRDSYNLPSESMNTGVKE